LSEKQTFFQNRNFIFITKQAQFNGSLRKMQYKRDIGKNSRL